MEIPIVEGRGFGTEDRAAAQPAAVISASLAAKYFPGQSPIGRRVKVSTVELGWITIVGVSGDVIDDWFANRNVPTIYLSEEQTATHWMNVVMRTNADPSTLEPAVRRVMASIDPNLPAYSVRTMTAALKERTTGLRFIGGLMAAFGAIALLLAAIGIYSVMAFYVTLRRKEMGVRLALGASPRAVLRMTLGQASRMSVIGVAIGSAIAIALSRVMEQAMMGTAQARPALFIIVALTLLAVSALASFVPAYGATKVDPATTLRD
jgi:ABC-type antimicrobial peptide transport system permease subunit